MNATYAILVTIPQAFEGVEVNYANAGLYALEAVLTRALATQGYRVTMSAGSPVSSTTVVAITPLVGGV